MSTFRILLAEDHPVFRIGVCSLIPSHVGWDVCGEASDGREAVRKCIRAGARPFNPRYLHAKPQRP